MEKEIKEFLKEKEKRGENKEIFYNAYFNNEDFKKYFVENYFNIEYNLSENTN